MLFSWIVIIVGLIALIWIAYTYQKAQRAQERYHADPEQLREDIYYAYAHERALEDDARMSEQAHVAYADAVYGVDESATYADAVYGSSSREDDLTVQEELDDV